MSVQEHLTPPESEVLDAADFQPEEDTARESPHNPNSYYPPPPNPADVQHWHMCGRGKRALLHGHRLFLKVGKPEREDKITDNE